MLLEACRLPSPRKSRWKSEPSAFPLCLRGCDERPQTRARPPRVHPLLSWMPPLPPAVLPVCRLTALSEAPSLRRKVSELMLAAEGERQNPEEAQPSCSASDYPRHG